MALSWRLQADKAVRERARRAGELVLLWAHPLEMQARSARSDFALTPARRIRTRGGFGHQGTGCLEFRALSRSSHCCLLLGGMGIDAAASELAETIKAIREDALLPPAQQEGLDGWVRDWQEDCSADPAAVRRLVDAMALFTLEMKRQGKSGRVLAGIYSDLEMAGLLVMMYWAPKARDVLSHFVSPPCEYEFRHKFSDSENAMVRYRRTLTAFGDYLIREGLALDSPPARSGYRRGRP